MARSIESPGRGELLLDILEIENDGHIAVEYLKKIDDLCILGAAAGRQADIEPLGGIPHEVGAVGLRVLGVVALDGRDALSHQLGRLIFTHGEASLDDHDGIFLERIAESIQYPWKDDDLHRTGQVLHAGEGHHRVGFGGHHPVLDDGTHDTDMIAVQLVRVLAGELLDAVGRKAVAKGIARADQDSIDDLNGRMTVVVDRLNLLISYRKGVEAFERETRLFQSSLMRQVDRIAENTDFLRELSSIKSDIFRLRQEGVRIKR